MGGIGKRSAEPGYGFYGPALVGHAYGGVSYTARSAQGIGKRSAEPGYAFYGPALAGHAYGGVSYTARSAQGIGKGSADPSYHTTGYSHQHVSRPYSAYGVGVYHG